MRNIFTIFRREVSAYFNSPIAYIFIILFVFILGFLFFVFFPFFSQTSPDLRNFFFWFPWVLSIFIHMCISRTTYYSFTTTEISL